MLQVSDLICSFLLNSTLQVLKNLRRNGDASHKYLKKLYWRSWRVDLYYSWSSRLSPPNVAKLQYCKLVITMQKNIFKKWLLIGYLKSVYMIFYIGEQRLITSYTYKASLASLTTVSLGKRDRKASSWHLDIAWWFILLFWTTSDSSAWTNLQIFILSRYLNK